MPHTLQKRCLAVCVLNVYCVSESFPCDGVNIINVVNQQHTEIRRKFASGTIKWWFCDGISVTSNETTSHLPHVAHGAVALDDCAVISELDSLQQQQFINRDLSVSSARRPQSAQPCSDIPRCMSACCTVWVGERPVWSERARTEQESGRYFQPPISFVRLTKLHRTLLRLGPCKVLLVLEGGNMRGPPRGWHGGRANLASRLCCGDGLRVLVSWPIVHHSVIVPLMC